MKALADISPVSEPLPARRARPAIDEEQCRRAEEVDPAELVARGVPAGQGRLHLATRSSWKTERWIPSGRMNPDGSPVLVDGEPELQMVRAQWVDYFDAWPSGLVDPETGAHPRTLLLSGNTGCGKSHVAAWIMRRFLASMLARPAWRVTRPVAGYTITAEGDVEGVETIREFRRGGGAVWVDVPKTIGRILDAMPDGDYQGPSLEHNTLRILDDIGAHQDTDFQSSTVERWIHGVDGSPGYVVATTNLTPAQLRDLYPRVASRLNAGPVVLMRGTDARRRRWVLR